MNGIYAVYMTGTEGEGFALLAFIDGVIAGADPLGVRFNGSYQQHADRIVASVTVTVPAGGTVIQGVTSGPSGLVYEVNLSVGSDLGGAGYLSLETPLGPVNAKLEKLCDLPRGRNGLD